MPIGAESGTDRLSISASGNQLSYRVTTLPEKRQYETLESTELPRGGFTKNKDMMMTMSRDHLGGMP
jgi:hypothetical protein